MSNTPVQPGDVLAGKYRVERILGIGSMGVVVQAMHVQLYERVALKFMRTEAMGDAELNGRFLREARLSAKLRSEHVAKVMDVGTLDFGSPYIAMEYLEGGDLEHLLAAHGPLPFADAAEYVIQACDAIAEAHALGIVHRDLKPANLFLTRRSDGAPLVKVLDFGISKAGAGGDIGGAMTRTSAMIGSPCYMSPEQMRSAKDVDARSDVWAMGVVLYEFVTARLPFDGSSLGDILAQILQTDPAPLAVHRPDVPPAFEAIVRHCLRRDRNVRAQDVGEIATALAPYAPPRARPIARRIVRLLGDADVDDKTTVPIQKTRPGHSQPPAPGHDGSPRPPPPPGYDPCPPAPGQSRPPGPILGVATVAPAVTTATRPPGKSGVGIVLGAIVIGIVLGGGAYFWSRGAQPEAPQPLVQQTVADLPAVTGVAPTAPAAASTAAPPAPSPRAPVRVVRPPVPRATATAAPKKSALD